MIFSKGVKTIQWEKKSFQQKLVRQLDIHMQKSMNLDLFFTPYIKFKSKWTKKAKAKTIKPLEGNMGDNLKDPGLGNSFSDMIPKAHTKKK